MIPVESHVNCTNYNNLITSIYNNNISNNNNNNNNNNSNKNGKEAKDGVQMGLCFDSCLFVTHSSNVLTWAKQMILGDLSH